MLQEVPARHSSQQAGRDEASYPKGSWSLALWGLRESWQHVDLRAPLGGGWRGRWRRELSGTCSLRCAQAEWMP